MSPNTERKYRHALQAAGLWEGDVQDLPSLSVLKQAVQSQIPAVQVFQQVSRVEPWRSVIEQLVQKGLSPRAIYDRLRLEDSSFSASYSAVKRMVRAIHRERGVDPNEVAICVETVAGEVAQVDFGYVGLLLDPATMTLRKAWCFVMVLGFSRHMVVRLVFDQKVSTWLRVHIEAFEELGGVPTMLVPDNLKAAVVRAAFGIEGGTELNRSYRELARYYGFQIDPTPSLSQEKGESGSMRQICEAKFLSRARAKRCRPGSKGPRSLVPRSGRDACAWDDR